VESPLSCANCNSRRSLLSRSRASTSRSTERRPDNRIGADQQPHSTRSMGIHDRDWYHDDARSRRSASARAPRTPEWSKSRPTGSTSSDGPGRFWTLLMAALAIAMAAFAAGQHWPGSVRPGPVDGSGPVRPPQTTSSLRDVSPSRPTFWSGAPNSAAIHVTPSTAAPTVIYRCLANGWVTYSGPADCNGSLQTSVSVPATPVRSTPPATAPSWLTPYQAQMLRSADERIARDRAAALTDTSGRLQRQETSANPSRSECAALAQALEALDAAARQPQLPAQADAIRVQRQQVSSRRYELRC